MWRPGLVWIEEGLARCLGSVRNGAAAASALGATLLELAYLCLACCCFGRRVLVFAFIGLVLPAVSSPFLELAVGQGPEVWAAAATLTGLIVLVQSLKANTPWQPAIPLLGGVAAGTIAGLAEWFRTGNFLLFAIPCIVYGGAALRHRDWRSGCLPAAAVVAWLGMAALGGMAVPSSVNKTVANLWACRVNLGGPRVSTVAADGGDLIYPMLHYTLVPATTEVHIDAILRDSRGRSTWDYVHEHASALTRAYIGNLRRAITSGFRGLRRQLGDLVLALFAAQLLFGLARRDDAASHTFALGGAALGYYLGPVILLAGDAPTHYLLVASPLFVLVGARGALEFAERITALPKRWRSILVRSDRIHAVRDVRPDESGHYKPWSRPAGVVLGLTVLLFAYPTVAFYHGLGKLLQHRRQQAVQEQAAVDCLGLEGLKVACRNMCWFVDRDVQTVLLPYATVPELESYVQAHGIDGILIWENESVVYFRANPYGSATEFTRALEKSARFGPPRVSGSWRWYPVRPRTSLLEQL